MENTRLYFGDAPLHQNSHELSFDTITYQDETYFKIDHYHQMPPFFMTVVSDADFWLFVSSTGGLTAGRSKPDNALFPYYTDDKIHDSSETTGAHTICIVAAEDRRYLWKPFSKHHADVYKITRSLYKNAIGNKIMFEELNHDLGVSYRYTWQTSNAFGFVKSSELSNLTEKPKSVRVLDGIRNILPYGVNQQLQMSSSTLVDGYKRSELHEQAGLGIFTLSSIISDRAEPSESLKATTVWTKGMDRPVYLLSEQQLQAFCRNEELDTEYDVKGRRGAFYISDDISLEGLSSKSWVIVSELQQSAVEVEALLKELCEEDTILDKLKHDMLKGDENLKRLVFEADGFQMTANQNTAFRHFSNTLYNIMRGGIYAEGYCVEKDDLKHFIRNWNHDVFKAHEDFFASLDEKVNYNALLLQAEKTEDTNLERLVMEYLPLTYSRRHGDPSRPWNMFNIEITKDNGEKNLNFEGNWRDIFQNWEALSISYPNYIESIIAKFVNASTADGYNPYRITKDGIDWELLDAEDPWSNIGYWGDHQIIYLLKLMELSQKYNATKLGELLSKHLFVYANVPYRIKGFDALIKDPRNSITFDDACEASVEKRVASIGCDGKLVFVDGELYHVSLMEKLLVTILAKLSNYVPEGGIWMNTQRPEWNDANNALVGNGVSMVTLYYMHRMLGFMADLLKDSHEKYAISLEVLDMFEAMNHVITEAKRYLGTEISDQERFKVVNDLGRIGEKYRQVIYTKGFSGEKQDISAEVLKEFISQAKLHLKDTIEKNRRDDGLYHAYNLIAFKDEACSISYLYEMLEGQVAALSSNALNDDEALGVLASLQKSSIYRQDQDSYMLYPNRQLPAFLEKNVIPQEAVQDSSVLMREIEKKETRIVSQDVNGQYHFNGRFRNGEEVMAALEATGAYSHQESLAVGDLFSELFNHHAFTGRSGTFYKYEGLGCIYWHMVSKLLLATQETFLRAKHADKAAELSAFYHAIKAGIGADKSPEVYGAFPTDAYSHTPGFAGVQQPGMTGQVKEDFISRFGELGVSVEAGEIHFNPRLLSVKEFLTESTEWQLPHATISLSAQQLGFTLCSIPVIYTLEDENTIMVCHRNGDNYKFENTTKLSREISQRIFDRSREITNIVVGVDARKLLQ